MDDFSKMAGTNLPKEKQFMIIYQDSEGNELWSSVTEKYTIEDADKYALRWVFTGEVGTLS